MGIIRKSPVEIAQMERLCLDSPPCRPNLAASHRRAADDAYDIAMDLTQPLRTLAHKLEQVDLRLKGEPRDNRTS